MFACVASRASMLHLAARTHDRAAVCLHAAHIAALRAFWTDWLPWHVKRVLHDHIFLVLGSQVDTAEHFAEDLDIFDFESAPRLHISPYNPATRQLRVVACTLY